MAKSKFSNTLKSWKLGQYTLVSWTPREILVNHPNQPQKTLYLFDSYIGRVELTNQQPTTNNNQQEIWLLRFLIQHLDKMDIWLGRKGFFIKFPTPGRVIIYKEYSTDINLKIYKNISQQYLLKLITMVLENKLSKKVVNEI